MTKELELNLIEIRARIDAALPRNIPIDILAKIIQNKNEQKYNFIGR